MEMPAYLNLQNKDFIVKHAIVILRLNLILSMITVLFQIKQNLQFKSTRMPALKNLSLSHA